MDPIMESENDPSLVKNQIHYLNERGSMRMVLVWLNGHVASSMNKELVPLEYWEISRYLQLLFVILWFLSCSLNIQIISIL